ncbi:MAG TPA: hypothetical protein VHS06_11115, partial [Chloroflexota bacterium]|nr:hypothetical protein [Chloroflexota bacterium]
NVRPNCSGLGASMLNHLPIESVIDSDTRPVASLPPLPGDRFEVVPARVSIIRSAPDTVNGQKQLRYTQ